MRCSAAAVAACALLSAACPGGGGRGDRTAAPLLVVSDRSGSPRIFEMLPGDPAGRPFAGAEEQRRAGGGSSPRAAGAWRDCAPALLPDGRVVFVSDRDGNPEIYLAAADGRTVTRLTHDPPEAAAVDSAPAPFGGTAIVFARGEPGDPDGAPADLYLLDLDGTPPRRLTRHPADDRTPAGSPDGRSILFVSEREGDPAVYRLPDARQDDPEASIEHLVSGARDPAVLPDGSFVVTRITPEGVPHLFHTAAGATGGERIGGAAISGWRQITDSLTLPFGALEPTIQPDKQVLFTTGPAGVPRAAEGSPRFAVYRIALGGINLSRVTRERAGYSDYARGLQVCR